MSKTLSPLAKGALILRGGGSARHRAVWRAVRAAHPRPYTTTSLRERMVLSTLDRYGLLTRIDADRWVLSARARRACDLPEPMPEPAVPKAPLVKGSTEFLLRSERNVGDARAGCDGYYHYVEEGVPDDAPDASTRRMNTPSMFGIVERALGENPEFDSVVKITVHVEVVKAGTPSTVKCHNPWPGHKLYCPHRVRVPLKPNPRGPW